MINTFDKFLEIETNPIIGKKVWFISKCEISTGYIQEIIYCRDYIKVNLWTKDVNGTPMENGVLITNVYETKEQLIEMLLEEL